MRKLIVFLLIFAAPLLAQSPMQRQTFTQTGTGAVATTVDAKLKQAVSVKDFGAAGDGVADDTAEIQAAIDSGAGHIYFPKGTYNVSTMIDVNDKKGIHIYGDGGGESSTLGATLHWTGSANGTIFRAYSCQYCLIERIRLDGTGTTPGIGLSVTGLNSTASPSNSTFQDITISGILGSPGIGVSLSSPTDQDLSINTFERINTFETVIGAYQDGIQTLNNRWISFHPYNFTDKGFVLVEGNLLMWDSTFGSNHASATADIEIGPGALDVHLTNTLVEINSPRTTSSLAISFPTGARLSPTTLDNFRVIWSLASGKLVEYLQQGPLIMFGNQFSGGGTGTVTINPGGVIDFVQYANYLQDLGAPGVNGIIWSIAANAANYTTTATAAGVTNLNMASRKIQRLTGTTTQDMILPVASTLPLGDRWEFINDSTGAVTVYSSGSNSIVALAGGTRAILWTILQSGTTAASWTFAYPGVAVASGKKLTVSNSITLAGTDGVVLTTPSTSFTAARTDAANTFTGVQGFSTRIASSSLATALVDQTSLRGNAMAAAAGNATIGQVIAAGATALNFASTATGACATVITATATGAVSTDVIIFNANASIKAVTGYVPAATGGFSIAAYPTTDTANFEACNWTSGTVDPGSITANWMVIR